MLTADFRHIAFAGGRRNSERLFRAAISAYCTLTRPTRKEAAQLSDLTLGLYDSVSHEARRFAAAALCECNPAPSGIVRRLCSEPVEIAAPLLVRCRALSDIDLIALIGRHGLSHARVIARRDNLNPIIASLIRSLIVRAQSEAETGPEEKPETKPDDTLEPVRDKLRAIMQQAPEIRAHKADPPPSAAGPDRYAVLLDLALAGDMTAFSSALGRALNIPADRAYDIATAATYSDLVTSLRAVSLSPEQAFLITAAIYPAQVAHRSAMRLFLQRYETIGEERARETVERWRDLPRMDGPAVQPLAIAR